MDNNPIKIYQTEDGETQIDVRFEDETVWLNRLQLSELFGRDVKTIGKHISNVFKEKELQKEAVVAKIATTAKDGKTYQVEYYNLDVIISVGYRVKSLQGTQFRIWATQHLKNILIQGYSLHQQRFEQNALALQQALKLIEKTVQSPVGAGPRACPNHTMHEHKMDNHRMDNHKMGNHRGLPLRVK